MQIDIDFEWKRDIKGYRLVPPEAPKPLKRASLRDRPSIFPDDGGSSARVLRRGGELVSCRPPLMIDTLCSIFAQMSHSAEGVYNFISQFGPLTENGYDRRLGDSVPYVLEQAKLMRELLKRSAEAPNSFLELVGVEGVHLTKLDVRLVCDPGLNSLRFRLSPRSLLDALWLQLAQKLSAGGVIRECQHCGRWFEAGPGSGRRLDAKFCSDDHRVVFNSRRRSSSTRVTGHKEGPHK